MAKVVQGTDGKLYQLTSLTESTVPHTAVEELDKVMAYLNARGFTLTKDSREAESPGRASAFGVVNNNAPIDPVIDKAMETLEYRKEQETLYGYVYIKQGFATLIETLPTDDETVQPIEVVVWCDVGE